MAERIVDVLKIVEVQAEYRHGIAGPAYAFQRRLYPFAEQQPVGQPGQRIVMRHEADARLRLPPVANILVCRDPPSVLHRLVRNRQRPPSGILLDESPRPASGSQGELLELNRLDDP